MTVVAPTYQVSRARERFARCWDGELAVVAARTSVWTRLKHLPYEIAAGVKAEVLQRSC